MRKVTGFLACSLLFGCMSNPGVVQFSPDTYMISRVDTGGVFGNAARMKAHVIKQANDFAASQGKFAIPISTNETPLRVGSFATIDYQFRVVSEDDPEYRRVSLKPRLDAVTEEKKDINLTIENKPGGNDSNQSLYDELVRLDDLRQRGLLSDAEFDEQKRKLLAKD